MWYMEEHYVKTHNSARYFNDWLRNKKKETHAGTNDQGHTNNIPGEKKTWS